jgi:hypothetical protein
MMKMLLASVTILPLLAGVAAARQPLSLNDAQMDQVTAGAEGVVIPIGGSPEFFNIPPGFIVDFISPTCPNGCYVLTFANSQRNANATFQFFPAPGFSSILEPARGTATVF